MVESHWLAQRAQTLQADCFDPETGKIADAKKFALYLRYETTHTRAFHKSLNDLLKLRKEAHISNLGFEAQRLQSEKHQMKKDHHYWDVLLKDAQAIHQLTLNLTARNKAQAEKPGFEAQFAAELAKLGLKEHQYPVNAAVAA